MSDKQALKGLQRLCMWPITANTKEAYTAGERFVIPHAQSLTKERQGTDYTIWADDDVYDTGNEYQSENLTVGLAELPLAIEAKLSGGEYDETTKTYHFKDVDIPPEFAVGYAARKKNGGFRMFKHYAVTLLSVAVEHKSGEGTGEIHPYTLNLRNTKRKFDGKIRTTHDEDSENFAFLDTIESLPESSGG